MLGPKISLMEDKYEKLSKKIFHIQNIELKNPSRSDNLEYQIDKFEVNMQRTMKDYDNKSNFLQGEMIGLHKLFQSKEEIRKNNMKKVSDEIALTESNMINILKVYRENMINKVDAAVSSIEANFLEVQKKQNYGKEQLIIAIERLKQIAEVDMIKLKEEADGFTQDNQMNITSTSQLLNEEFNYIHNQIQKSKELRELNENKFIKDIQNDMNKIRLDVDSAKTERERFEENIFETIAATIERLQYAVADK